MKLPQVVAATLLVAMASMLTGCGPAKLAQKAKEKLIEKTLSKTAIAGFIDLEGPLGEHVMEYCKTGESYKMHNITDNIWWPGCGMISKFDDFNLKSDGGKCEENACLTRKGAEEMDAFNDKYGGKLVTYKSRAGKDDNGKDIDVVDLTGWWLPAPNANADTPRLVLQHGFTSNSNKYRQQYLAYLLRKLGYSVLVNNLRDHCYSDKTKEKLVGWGAAYPLDTLGAWDFAKDHADDNPIDKSKVGIIGLSMGAFTTLNAFGIAGEVPAVWVDGPPMTPRAGFSHGLYLFLKNDVPVDVSFLHKHVMDEVWEDIEDAAKKKGVDLNGHLPAKELAKGPDTKRPIFVTANKGDDTVKYENSVELTNEILKKYPKKYELAEFWSLDASCGDSTHCVDFLTTTEDYVKRLDSFWSMVFTGSKYESPEETKSDDKEEAKSDDKEEAKSDEKEVERLYTQRDERIGYDFRLQSIGIIVGAFASMIAIGLAVVVRRAYMSRGSQDEGMQAEVETTPLE